MSEKFSLKWNDFQSNIAKSFSKLRYEDSFYDVTLVSDDQKEMSAHKVILSSCSDFFKNILKNKRNSDPILCLEGVNFNEMKNVLDYIYNGQVEIHQDDLDRFLMIAQRFKLEGLIGEQNFVEEEIINSQPNKEETKDLDIITDKEEIFKVRKNKSQIVVSSAEFDSIEELEQTIEKSIERAMGSKWKCRICEKTFRDKTDARLHVEVHFDGLSFPCQTCDKTFRSRAALKKHRYITKHQ